jgi:chromosome transmission fidelity protein 8
MPSVPLHLPDPNVAISAELNPLPTLLQTPSGLAILELQGTIHAPSAEEANASADKLVASIGKLVFPLYSDTLDEEDARWIKRVYLYVGKHQRLTGEVRKLGKPLGVLARRKSDEDGEELEILEVVRFKIVFSTRPEPVGGESAEGS